MFRIEVVIYFWPDIATFLTIVVAKKKDTLKLKKSNWLVVT